MDGDGWNVIVLDWIVLALDWARLVLGWVGVTLDWVGCGTYIHIYIYAEPYLFQAFPPPTSSIDMDLFGHWLGQFWPSLGPDDPVIPWMWNCLALFGPRFVLTFVVQVRTRSGGGQQVHSGAQKVAHRDGDNCRFRLLATSYQLLATSY